MEGKTGTMEVNGGVGVITTGGNSSGGWGVDYEQK